MWTSHPPFCIIPSLQNPVCQLAAPGCPFQRGYPRSIGVGLILSSNVTSLRPRRSHVMRGKAIQQVADRLDGKPAQESTLTLDRHDVKEWTREELLKESHDCQKRPPFIF